MPRMILRPTHLRNSTWATPTGDGERLIDPELSLWPERARANRATFRASNYDVQGVSIGALAADARRELLAAALDATRAYRDATLPTTVDAACPLLFTAGHQPEIFHPGVWLKNALLSQAAASVGGIAVNLTIDTDLIKSSNLRVPGGTIAAPRWEPIALDDGPSQVPWETRAVADIERLRTWPERMTSVALAPAQDGCWREYWPLVMQRAAATGNLGLAFAQARHRLEADWGLNTLELPVSRAVQTPAARRLLLHLLAHLPRLTEVYNGALAEYRAAHGITSRAHPAPSLETRGEWIEAPFWVRDDANPRRRRVWALLRDDVLRLSDGDAIEADFPLTPDQPTDEAVAAWEALEVRGVRLRTKALITTLIARVLWSDLFVHGIGGAKYDETTDRIIAEFFGFPAPDYAVASGTLRWPALRADDEALDEAELLQRIRATEFQPERFLQNGAVGEFAEAIAQASGGRPGKNAGQRAGSTSRNHGRESRPATRRASSPGRVSSPPGRPTSLRPSGRHSELARTPVRAPLVR
ncbi:MAG: hypothetical protein QM811_18565 [Pirellulales bacterium]